MKTNLTKIFSYIVAVTCITTPITSFAEVNTNINASVNVPVRIQTDVRASTSSGTSTNSGKSQMEINANTGLENASIKNEARQNTSSTNGDISESSGSSIGLYAKSIIQSDDNVTDVSANDNKVSVSYKEPVKFLGLIPTTLNITAQSDVNGNVNISYPWYSFLFHTNSAELHASAQAKAHAATKSVVMTKSSTTASVNGNSSFSVQLKTALINALHVALQSQTSN